MCGGPVVGFAREASGSSQADKLVEIYADGDVSTKEYTFKKTVMPVFLKSPAQGKISNVEAFAGISKLPTFLNEHIWFKNGDSVPQTVDYLTSIGIVALAGNRELISLDYEKIRNMDSKLVIQNQKDGNDTYLCKASHKRGLLAWVFIGHQGNPYQVARPAPWRTNSFFSTKLRKCSLSVLPLAPVARTMSRIVTRP